MIDAMEPTAVLGVIDRQIPDLIIVNASLHDASAGLELVRQVR
jgi:hypothetical protein